MVGGAIEVKEIRQWREPKSKSTLNNSREQNPPFTRSDTIQRIQQPAQRQRIYIRQHVRLPMSRTPQTRMCRLQHIRVHTHRCALILLGIPSRVSIARRAPRERRVQIFQEDDAPRGYTAHEGRQRAVVDPRRRQRYDVDIEHKLAGDSVDQGALA